MTHELLADALADRYLLDESWDADRAARSISPRICARDVESRSRCCTRPGASAASGPFIQTYLAQIYVLNGDLDNSVATLRPLLTFPSWITPAELATDPLWAPLKSHSAFQSLLATP